MNAQDRVPLPEGGLVSLGLFVGAVVPFALERPVIESDWSSKAVTTFPDQDLWVWLRRQMYGPEKMWYSVQNTRWAKFKLHNLRLSSDVCLPMVEVEAHFIVYNAQFGTAVFWCDAGAGKFAHDEIVEFAALARGTKEYADPSSERSPDEPIRCTWRWGETERSASSLLSVWDTVIEEAVGGGKSGQRTSTSFAFPIIYLPHVMGCGESTELVAKYSASLAALSHLWRGFEAAMLKPHEVQDALCTDFHPFNYGITIVTSAAIVEAHTSSLEAAASHYGLSLVQHHFEERINLSLQAEVPIARHFILRRCLALLGDPSTKLVITEEKKSPWLPWNLLNLIAQADRMVRLHNEFQAALRRFDSYYLTRKPYIPKAVQAIANRLNTDRAENALEQRLQGLRENLSIIYSFAMTLIGTVLAVIGTVFAIIQTISALKGG